MLPKVSKKNQEKLVHELDNPQQCFIENKGNFLIGVLNIKTNKVYLLPCIQEKVWLEMDSSGHYVKGWKFLKGMKKGKELSAQDVAQYNITPYPPRVISVSNSSPNDEDLRSHTFVLEVLNDLENRKDYRGFSVKPGKDNEPTVYQWDSTSLNQTWDGFNLSKVMLLKHQRIVRNTLEPSLSLGGKCGFAQVFKNLGIACLKYKQTISITEIDHHAKHDIIRLLQGILSHDDYSDDTARFNAFRSAFQKNRSFLTQENDKFGVLFVKVISTLLSQGIAIAYSTWKTSKKQLQKVENIEKNLEVGPKFRL